MRHCIISACVFILLASYINLYGQCTPNPGLFNNPGIEPDTMPDGYANNFYDEVVGYYLSYVSSLGVDAIAY